MEYGELVDTYEALEAAVADAVGEAVDLEASMVEFVRRTPEGVEGTEFDVDGDGLGVVYVDTALTEDIESKGYAREVRADEFGAVEDGHRETWDVEGVEMEIAVEPREADQREASERASGN